MYHDFSYEATLASSLRAQWQLDDVLRVDQDLDFSRRFMPESLARTAALGSLSPLEQRVLNHISAHQYLSIFGVVEEFILPFVVDHARPHLQGDDWRIRAILNFASEEAKHIQLFKRFHGAFVRGFPVECQMIGPSEAIGAEVLRHDPLAVGLVILMIEWMSQQHYLGSIRDDGDLDPLFKSLLKNHWMEEAQHAKLDTLVVGELAEKLTAAQIDAGISDFLAIGTMLDGGMVAQVQLDLESLSTATGRTFTEAEKQEITQAQTKSYRWCFLVTGMTHPNFERTLEQLTPGGAARV
ncbi:MAG: diiron oxygenase, partial [Sphingomicrobium sp.]